MLNESALFIVITLAFGASIALGVFYFSSKKRVIELEGALSSESLKNETLRAERDSAIQQTIRLEAELGAERKQAKAELQNRLDSLNEAKNALAEQFKNLASEILEDKSKRFTEQNALQLDAILKPLQTKLSEFKEQVSNSYNQESRERFALKNEIERLSSLNIKMSDETRSLTQALKGDSKIQGNWGELVLETILESSGLRKGEEYLVQDSHTQIDGSRLQPDIVVRLPEGRHLVIDSKVSITAYARYAEANEEKLLEQELAAHIQSMRQHIQGLSGKNYSAISDLSSVDFVLMFIPIEPDRKSVV